MTKLDRLTVKEVRKEGKLRVIYEREIQGKEPVVGAGKKGG